MVLDTFSFYTHWRWLSQIYVLFSQIAHQLQPPPECTQFPFLCGNCNHGSCSQTESCRFHCVWCGDNSHPKRNVLATASILSNTIMTTWTWVQVGFFPWQMLCSPAYWEPCTQVPFWLPQSSIYLQCISLILCQAGNMAGSYTRPSYPNIRCARLANKMTFEG